MWSVSLRDSKPTGSTKVEVDDEDDLDSTLVSSRHKRASIPSPSQAKPQEPYNQEEKNGDALREGVQRVKPKSTSAAEVKEDVEDHADSILVTTHQERASTSSTPQAKQQKTHNKKKGKKHRRKHGKESAAQTIVINIHLHLPKA